MAKGFVTDIKKAAKENDFYRNVIFTAPHSQLVLMAIEPGDEIGLEVHDGDQILYFVDGEGKVILDGEEQEVEKGTIAFVPAGVQHNVVNTDDEKLKLFTVYAPPQHPWNTVERKKKVEAAPREERWPEEAPPDVDSTPAKVH
jgi:mannose-6-phosphate isomerase-like protein (cupin superfamily)